MKRNESDKGCSLSYRNRTLARSCSNPSPWKWTSKRCIESNSVGVSVEKIINFLISGSRIEAVVAYAKTSYKGPVRVQSSMFRFSVGTTRRNRSFPEFSVRSSEAKLPLGTAPSRFLHAKARVTITIQITRQLVTCACLTALINERKRQTWRRELDFFLCRCRKKEKNDGIARNPAAFVSVRAYTRSCFSVNVGGCLCEGVEVFLDDTV